MTGFAQRYPFETKPYAIENGNIFYRYDPGQCILCGLCVEACQDLEVNETSRYVGTIRIYSEATRVKPVSRSMFLTNFDVDRRYQDWRMGYACSRSGPGSSPRSARP